MKTKPKTLAFLIGLGLLFGVTVNPAMAKLSEHQSQKTSQFSKIGQPLLLKVGVTLGGVVLIGAELWWFLLSKHQSNKS